MSFSILFEPIRLGSLRVKNRLVMPPMVRNYADEKGMVTKRYMEHVERLARGGVGLMILEASFIRPEGRGFTHELGLHTDAVIPGLKKLVTVAHKYRAAIGIQVYHAGRQTSSKTTGMSSVAPSPIADPIEQEVPHELTLAEIKDLVQAYADGAMRAKKAGMDFVELHGAHGYLITQFLSPFTNHRTDTYGGSEEKRFRFLKEVYTAVRKAVGEKFPVIVRLSGEEMVKGGLTIQDTLKIAKKLEELGANALHISAGNYASYVQGCMIAPMAQPDGLLVHLVKPITHAVKIPVIAVGKIRTPDMAARIIHRDEADMVAIGRSLLADPEWPNKVAAGKEKDIHPCIACNQGCISRLFAQQDVWCTVNPETGREGLFSKKPGKPKRIVVIGGGPAGLEAAKVAAQRGHHVDLFEKTGKLGGQLWAASLPPHRPGWKQLAEALIREVKKHGVRIHLKKEFTPEIAERHAYDAAIVALGSSAIKPKIPGIERLQVVMAREVLEGKARARGRVVVAGGGCMGAQTAEFLADKGHAVTIIEASENVAIEAPLDDRNLLLGRLAKRGVKSLIKTKVISFGSKSVIIETNGKQRSIPADTVVICMGSFSNNGLAHELKPLIKQVHVVGDGAAPRRVTDAIAEGALAVLDIEQGK